MSKSTYQQIIKTTSLFGGVQVFSILISIIRSKLISVFIGPIGFGIASLLNSTLNIISGISGLGIEMSGVKHLSENYDENNLDVVSKQVFIIRRIALLTGIAGAFLVMLFSKWLSLITFGTEKYTFSFILISITLLFKQLASGELIVLQGLRQLKYLAKSSFYGNLFGLIFSIPIYYYFTIDAIVPTIVLASFFSMVFAFVFARKIPIVKVKFKSEELLTEGKSIIKLGLALTFSGLITLISAYLIQVFLNFSDGVEMVGFYNSGFTLLNSYVGVLFIAMSTDYFPRLSEISKDNVKLNQMVLQQAYIGILIITPIILIFVTFSDEIIQLLFSSKFKVISSMVSFGIFGMLFRIVSFSIGYMILAKAESKLFIKTSIGFNILYLLLSIFGYFLYGLPGLGIAFTVQYVFHLLILSIIVRKKYNFQFDTEIIAIFSICFLFCTSIFALMFLEDNLLKRIISIVLILISCYFSFTKIDDKVDLKSLLKQKIK